MINVKKKYTILNGAAPYQIFVQGEHSVQMISNNQFEVEFIFEDQDNIQDRNISVIDANGCISAIETSSAVLDPCTEFFVSPISKSGRRYSVEVVSDTSVIYDWDFDEGIFNGSEVSNYIDLFQYTGGPQLSTLSVTVTNADGCSETRTFDIPVCRVFAQSASAQFVNVGNQYVANVTLRASSSCAVGINWDTLNITGDIAGLTIINNGPNVTITSQNLPADLVLNYTVRDNSNIISNTANLSLSANGQLGLDVPSIIIDGLPTVGDIEFDIDDFIRDFVDPTTININNNLTTSNISAMNTGSQFMATLTGNTGVIGYDADDINGNPLNPGTISVVRDFADFTTTNVVVNSPCSGATSTYVLAGNPSVTEIVSVLGANGITKNGINPVALDITDAAPTQTITLNVKNGNNQTASLQLDYCRSCANPTVSKDVCESVINPYSLLTKPTPNGTWTTSNGAPLPATYNGNVTLPTNGLYSYVYSVNNSTPSGESCPVITSALEVTKIAGTNITNDNCSTPKALFAILDEGTSASIESISADCNSLTTFSKTGANGNLGDYTYDQWFTYESSSTLNGMTTMDIKVTITGTGNTPLQSPAVQVWSSCVSPIVTSYNQGTNQIIATFNVPTDGSVNDYLIQVCADSLGDYSIFIEQEIV